MNSFESLYGDRINKNGPIPSHVPSLGHCWEWAPSAKRNTYGAINICGTVVKAHRMSWESVNGAIPNGLCVLHKCDYKPCVNPSHLFVGTKQDNTRDLVAKGRDKESRKTKCPKGHEYSASNTGYERAARHRYCKECKRQKTYEKYYKEKGGPIPTQPRKWVAGKV